MIKLAGHSPVQVPRPVGSGPRAAAFEAELGWVSAVLRPSFDLRSRSRSTGRCTFAVPVVNVKGLDVSVCLVGCPGLTQTPELVGLAGMLALAVIVADEATALLVAEDAAAAAVELALEAAPSHAHPAPELHNQPESRVLTMIPTESKRPSW